MLLLLPHPPPLLCFGYIKELGSTKHHATRAHTHTHAHSSVHEQAQRLLIKGALQLLCKRHE